MDIEGTERIFVTDMGFAGRQMRKHGWPKVCIVSPGPDLSVAGS